MKTAPTKSAGSHPDGTSLFLKAYNKQLRLDAFSTIAICLGNVELQLCSLCQKEKGRNKKKKKKTSVGQWKY